MNQRRDAFLLMKDMRFAGVLQYLRKRMQYFSYPMACFFSLSSILEDEYNRIVYCQKLRCEVCEWEVRPTKCRTLCTK
jgi:hypothetical protein